MWTLPSQDSNWLWLCQPNASILVPSSGLLLALVCLCVVGPASVMMLVLCWCQRCVATLSWCWGSAGLDYDRARALLKLLVLKSVCFIDVAMLEVALCCSSPGTPRERGGELGGTLSGMFFRTPTLVITCLMSFDGLGVQGWSHWIRAKIPNNTGSVLRPELPRRSHSCKNTKSIFCHKM